MPGCRCRSGSLAPGAVSARRSRDGRPACSSPRRPGPGPRSVILELHQVFHGALVVSVDGNPLAALHGRIDGVEAARDFVLDLARYSVLSAITGEIEAAREP